MTTSAQTRPLDDPQSKLISFEDGSLVNPTSGVTRISGNVVLDSTSAIKGVYAASIHPGDSAYLDEKFAAAADVFVSFYLRLNALPSSDVRIALFSNDTTTVGNIVLRTSGTLRLRQGSTVIGAESAPLTPGAVYRLGLHQKRGAGADAVLEGYIAPGDDPFGAPFASTASGSWTSPAGRLRFGATNSNALDATFDDIALEFGAAPQPGPTPESTGTPTPTPVLPAATQTPTPTLSGPTPTPGPIGSGIWISAAELASKPTSGTAWNNLLSAANAGVGTPNLADQDDLTNVVVLAKALVFARTGEAKYRDGVVAALTAIVNSGTYNGRALALGRELAAYVISADLIGLRTYNPELDNQFRDKIRELRDTYTSGGPTSLINCHERRPNNWGNHCGASRVAIDMYLGDTTDLARAARVFKGWLGDRAAYAGFSYGELSWQCNSSAPVGINPLGCAKQGHSLDGVIPDDARRCGAYSWPPCYTDYAWESLQGATVQAQLLARAGYDSWNWQDRAVCRAVQWVYDRHKEFGGWWAAGDDSWTPWLVNYACGTGFPATSPSAPGKNMGWTDWVYAR